MRRLGSLLMMAGGILAAVSLVAWYTAEEVKVDGEPAAGLVSSIGLAGVGVAVLVTLLGAYLRRRATIATRSGEPASHASDSRR